MRRHVAADRVLPLLKAAAPPSPASQNQPEFELSPLTGLLLSTAAATLRAFAPAVGHAEPAARVMPDFTVLVDPPTGFVFVKPNARPAPGGSGAAGQRQVRQQVLRLEPQHAVGVLWGGQPERHAGEVGAHVGGGVEVEPVSTTVVDCWGKRASSGADRHPP